MVLEWFDVRLVDVDVGVDIWLVFFQKFSLWVLSIRHNVVKKTFGVGTKQKFVTLS